MWVLGPAAASALSTPPRFHRLSTPIRAACNTSWREDPRRSPPPLRPAKTTLPWLSRRLKNGSPASAILFLASPAADALLSPSPLSNTPTVAGGPRTAPAGKRDIVLGIASSGRTPFTIAAVEYAHRRGARTIALTCNRNSPLERAADFAIVTEVGAEVLAGSSRMKAGTAHKMVLNMISTGAMTRLGYVYGNLMVNVWTKNEKLVQRAIRILEQATGADHDTASAALEASGNRTPVAVVMLAAGVNRSKAAAALKKSRGHLRQAIVFAET